MCFGSFQKNLQEKASYLKNPHVQCDNLVLLVLKGNEEMRLRIDEEFLTRTSLWENFNGTF